jgi:hypothetical protein
MQVQQNNFFDKKMKYKEFKKGDLIMMFDAQHHNMPYNKLLHKWFKPFNCHQKLVGNNGSYELENVDVSPYPDHVNHAS